MEFESAQPERTDLLNDDNQSDKTGSEGSEGFVKGSLIGSRWP